MVRTRHPINGRTCQVSTGPQDAISGEVGVVKCIAGTIQAECHEKEDCFSVTAFNQLFLTVASHFKGIDGDVKMEISMSREASIRLTEKI